MSAAQVTTGLSKLKKKHFRVKHQKVKLFRASEPILSVFMWGVNHTVSILVSPKCLVPRFLPQSRRIYSVEIDNNNNFKKIVTFICSYAVITK